MILLSLMAFVVFMMIRNCRVYRFRMRLLGLVSNAAQRDIETDFWGGWRWRYERLASVDYNRMMLLFWKPLKPEAWWDDTGFLA